MRFNILLLFIISYYGEANCQWEKRADLPNNGRQHAVAFSLNGSGYLLTGMGIGNEFINDDVFKYDPELDSWEQLNNFPGGSRRYAIGATSGNKAYVGFGSGVRNSTEVLFSDLWEFDGTSETWKELTACPCEEREIGAMIATSTDLFVGFGYNDEGNFNDWWQYDIANDVWIEKADFPNEARHDPYYFQIDDVPYIGFGHGRGFYNDLYSYDLENDEWKYQAAIRGGGGARVGGAEFSYDKKGYVLSGERVGHRKFDTGEFWEYDPSTNSFTELPPHPGTSRWGPSSFVINDKVYFVGGETAGIPSFPDKSMWSFDLSEPNATSDESISAISIFPNPTSGSITIKSELDIVKLEILDSAGRLVKSSELNNSLNLINQSAGLYFVKIITREGNIFWEKVILN